MKKIMNWRSTCCCEERREGRRLIQLSLLSEVATVIRDLRKNAEQVEKPCRGIAKRPNEGFMTVAVWKPERTQMCSLGLNLNSLCPYMFGGEASSVT